jgi:hypothetical protein
MGNGNGKMVDEQDFPLLPARTTEQLSARKGVRTFCSGRYLAVVSGRQLVIAAVAVAVAVAARLLWLRSFIGWLAGLVWATGQKTGDSGTLSSNSFNRKLNLTFPPPGVNFLILSLQ